MRHTIRHLLKQSHQGIPLTMVTCYDYTFARLVEQAEIDIILVGDSMGNVIQGHQTTLPVTLEDIVYHTRAVARAQGKAHLLADLPFMSYQAGEDDAMRAAGRLLKEGGAQSVKLEGGESMAPLIRRMTAAGIPVCGHLGLTPQSVHTLGGFRVQGKGTQEAKRLMQDALALQEAGAWAIVLEMIPQALAREVTQALEIPTVGIGAGPGCAGQVLVLQDMLGMNSSFSPRFVKAFAQLESTVVDALQAYKQDVTQGSFPGPEHSF